MAYEVVLSPLPAQAKVRSPWGVLGLSLVTLGFYVPFWWYFINREMRDYGRARQVEGLGDSPATSAIAYTLGAIVVVPAIWTFVTTCQRIRRMQRAAGSLDSLNWGIIVLLAIFTLGIAIHPYMQSQLNTVWRGEEHTRTGAAQLAAATAPVADADLDRIEKLAKLHASGAITQEQFESQRAKLLDQ